MNNVSTSTAQPPQSRRFGCMTVTLIVLAAIIVTAGVTFWIIRTYVFPAEFTPVTLNTKEEQVLNAKLERLDPVAADRGRQLRQSSRSGELKPERYSEEGASREISFTEKELNALVAKNTDLARKLAIDLSDDLVSAKLLVPIDEDFPVLGGQILKVRAGLELAYQDRRPVVVLRGISVMGVPLPNAWLGGLKNIDLVREFGQGEGFWKSFADGIEHIHVQEERLKIKLKE